MNIPKIDNRDSKDVLNEVKALAKQYVPEWNFDESDPDFGVVFSKIFSNMFETSITKYNRSSYNHYITFLNLLGVKLLPSISAAGMVTVDVVPNSKGVYIEKGTSLYASADNDEGRVYYQTQDVMYAIDNRINSILLTDGENDIINEIYKFSEEQKDITPFRIYDSTLYENLQKHIIYFQSDYIFKTENDSNFKIQFSDKQSLINNDSLIDIFSNKENVKWQYYKKEEWKDIEEIKKDGDILNLKFNNSCDPYDLGNGESLYIRCIFNKIPKDDLHLTNITYASEAKDLQPNTVLSNTSELSKTNFFPFEEQYNIYTDFYISSDEAFSKKGAEISINIDMKFLKVKMDAEQIQDNTRYRYLMTEMDFQNFNPSDVQIEKVAWEYWNGFGWAKLYKDNTNEDFFLAKEQDSHIKNITFTCPNDISPFIIGPSESLFIRARIIKISNGFSAFVDYITPYINNITIDYNYNNEGCNCDSILSYSNLKIRKINFSGKSREVILKNELFEKPAIYLCLDKPIEKGPTRILLNIETGIFKDNPSVIWEYYSRNKQGYYQWKNIETMDSTDNFVHSAIITIIGKDDFSKATFFGETGYFIRIVNHDNKYSTIKNVNTHPMVNGIHFNTINVVQTEVRVPEYFSIERGQESKICKLSSRNISDAKVWVNEFENLSVLEEEKFIETDNNSYKKEYDEKGRVNEIWIEWEPIHSIAAAGENDRVFEIDYNKGQIIFGNGKFGKIPAHQEKESIKVEYSISEGSTGNINANMILGFSDAVPYVSKVTNLKPMVGGITMETIDFAAKRMSGKIRGMDRLVTLDDFEYCITYNDRNINKVKCITHVNKLNEEEMGTISIAILPQDYMQGYEKFIVLKERIQKFINDKASITLKNNKKISIFEVMYVEISVSLNIAIDDYNNYQQAYQMVYKKLKKFLDPIEGNFDGNGWDIGQLPRKEIIYNYIKMTPNIKWIKEINLFTKIVTKDGKKEIDFEEVKSQKFTVPVFGEPEINMSIE